ncbi:MAG: amidohydrolase family protein, partial [Deltaproteobacteria bacterium]|nr:amidohydrolase family protein [Deltaproteobacteria bacterium]
MSHPSPDFIDLILTNGTILPKPSGSSAIPLGALAIDRGRIVAVGPKGKVESTYKAKKIIDAREALIMPGLVNAHTHASMTLFRGLADDLPLEIWLEAYMFPAEKKWISEEFVYWGALLACAEMI